MDGSQGSQAETMPLRIANTVLVTVFYAAFPTLVALRAVLDGDGPIAPGTVRTLVVATVAFVAVSVVRALIDAPRPYDVSGEEPLLPRDSHGASFPSRHVFSCFMIAMCWLAWVPGVSAPWTPACGFAWPQAVAAVLMCLGVAMCFIRVAGGVHWVRDVVVGALVGIACGLIGFWAIP